MGSYPYRVRLGGPSSLSEPTAGVIELILTIV